MLIEHKDRYAMGLYFQPGTVAAGGGEKLLANVSLPDIKAEPKP
jgi:hypothetical protein